MRLLHSSEFAHVSGGTTSCSCYCPPSRSYKAKGNNGFGNGSDAPNTAAPGNSGSTGGGKADSSGTGTRQNRPR